MEKKVLELKNVTASYKEGKTNKEVLSEVSFSIYEGEIVGLLGDSGSGKTTLCKCILRLLKDYSGEVVHYTDNPQMIFQDPFGSLNPKKKIGWILEEPLKIKSQRKKRELDEALKHGNTKSESVRKNSEPDENMDTANISDKIKSGVNDDRKIEGNSKWNKKMRQKKVAEALARVNLPTEFCRRYPRELSGGQRQRVSIALALITGAKFILADEPLSALDVTVQAQIIKLLKKLQEEEGISFLFVSHDVDVVADLCRRVLIIEDGKLFHI